MSTFLKNKLTNSACPSFLLSLCAKKIISLKQKAKHVIASPEQQQPNLCRSSEPGFQSRLHSAVFVDEKDGHHPVHLPADRGRPCHRVAGSSLEHFGIITSVTGIKSSPIFS